MDVQLFTKPIEETAGKACLRPVKFKGQIFSCGKCDRCKVRKMVMWQSKMLMEASEFDFNGLFVTLTYAPEHLPDGGNLVKKDLQDFLKRYRRYYEYYYGYTKLRYFAAGEYGDKRGRPHYHLILFGADKAKSSDIIKRAWQKGIVDIRPLTGAKGVKDAMNTFRYVAAYVAKKFHSITSTYPDLEPEFTLYSTQPALGDNRFRQIVGKLMRDHKLIPWNGLNVAQRWTLERGVIEDPELKLWSGVFKYKGYMVSVPKRILRDLTKEIHPYILDVLDLNIELMTNDWDDTYAEYDEIASLHDEAMAIGYEYVYRTDEAEKAFQEQARQIGRAYRAGKVKEEVYQRATQTSGPPEVTEYVVPPEDYERFCGGSP